MTKMTKNENDKNSNDRHDLTRMLAVKNDFWRENARGL